MDVLVVDPGELGELLTTLLSQYGLIAARVQTGEAALAMALDAKPLVIVVEAELPDTAGLDLAELLHQELDSRVVLTHAPGLPFADAGTGARIRALDAAFARPFRSLALIETVARLAEKHLTRPGGAVASSPLMSTEGMPIEELADLIDIAIDDDDAGVTSLTLAEDEVSFAGVDAVAAAASSARNDEVPEILLEAIAADDEEVATATAKTTRPVSAEAARPLTDVLDEEARQRQQGAFSPGELAELWKRVKARRSATSTTPAAPEPEGVLTPRALADLLDAFHQSQTTGELWLENAPAAGEERGRRVLLVKRGVLAGARSNLVGEDLLSLLKKRNALDDDDAAEAFTLVKTGVWKTAADAILGLELLPLDVLRGHIEDHVRRVTLGAFSWPAGRYRVTLEGRAAKEPVSAEVFVGDAIVHAILFSETDESLEKAAPNDARFAPSTDGAYGLEHLRLSPQEARIVIAMDGTKTIGDLITLFQPLPARMVRGLAAGLFCLHLTRFVGRGPAAARKISFF